MGIGCSHARSNYFPLAVLPPRGPATVRGLRVLLFFNDLGLELPISGF